MSGFHKLTSRMSEPLPTAKSKSTPASAILIMHCPDQCGIVAAVTEFLCQNRGNILDLEQHVDQAEKVFFMRVEWDISNFAVPREKIGEFFKILVAEKFSMEWDLRFSDTTQRMAIYVSKLTHCIYDILSRASSGEWNVEIPLIIGNHSEAKTVADQFGIEFVHSPVNSDNKSAEEERQLEMLEQRQIDFIVLARYMQILSPEFVKRFPNKVINIHHSFLPAFPGARPYHSAHKRGVKIIGATSHYVTADLDAGPIIEQDVARVSHLDSVEDLVRKGRDVEKTTLSRAIYAHLNQKTLVYQNRTIVFS